MPEIPDVVMSETIEEEWGNDIRDRTVQRYADATERAADHSSPVAGDLSYLADEGSWMGYHAGAWRHLGVPTGTIIDHAGGSIPVGYLVCDGSAVSRTTYARLFAQIGETWGAGDESTTFNVPDLRGRVARGVAASGTGNAVGEKFGADTHTHTGPSHSHSNPNTSSDNHSHSFSDTSSSAGSHAHSQGNTGSGGVHNHGNTAFTSGPINTFESGTSPFDAAGGTHVHATSNSSSHVHSNPNTSTAPSHTHSVSGTTGGDSHAHSQGNTGSGGTGNTGSASTIQAGAAVNKLIKT